MGEQPKSIKRVGLVFSGGPAPAANAVISAAALSFVDIGVEVVGFFHGYNHLQEYDASTHPLVEQEHYRFIREADATGIRNERGILIGTSRANPGIGIHSVEDLDNPTRTTRLRRIHQGLLSLDIDALISIGGDDTLKTANFLYEYQRRLPPTQRRVRLVHLPKTIDNDYRGIDFTFGFFTAVDVMAKELLNLRADCIATSSYFIVETMGRKAGWISYGVAVAGEANMVISNEDVDSDLAVFEERTDPDTGERVQERRLSVTALVDRIVDLILTRERQNKHYGTVVLAEGLCELLPQQSLEGLPRDEHGHLRLGSLDLGKFIAERVSARYEERTGYRKKIRGIQLGYESRCASPHAFDVMLGSQLGVGAWRALVEEGLDGHMVSVSGQLDLHYIPFSELVNPQTLLTEVRLIDTGSDFHRLARFLETRTERLISWLPGRREEPPVEE